MPDTGAPWNIPYVEAADLVSDWPADSLALANAIDAGLDAAGNAGIGSNVVQTVKTDAFSTSSTSFTGVTGLTATITPSSSSSKVLVLVQLSMSNSSDNNRTIFFRLSGGNAANYTTGRDGVSAVSYFSNMRNGSWPYVGIYLDSPSTTSATTYGVEVRTTADTLRVNTDGFGTLVDTVSSITAIEVAA